MFVLCLGTHCKMQRGCHMMCKPWVLIAGFALRRQKDNWHFLIFQHTRLFLCSNNSFKSSQITHWVLFTFCLARQSSTLSGPFPLIEGKVCFGAHGLPAASPSAEKQISAWLFLSWTRWVVAVLGWFRSVVWASYETGVQGILLYPSTA